jgi:hypothetical protein
LIETLVGTKVGTVSAVYFDDSETMLANALFIPLSGRSLVNGSVGVAYRSA